MPRFPLLALLILAVAAFAPAPVPAEAPRIGASLPVTADFFTPLVPTLIQGDFTVRLPGDVDCPQGLSYGFWLEEVRASLYDQEFPQAGEHVQVEIVTPNGTIAASELQPNANITRPLELRVTVGTEIVAFANLDVLVRIRTQACGNLEAGTVVAQTGARVAYRPDLLLEIVMETSNAWRVRATNLGNAATQVDWIARQPTKGTILSGSNTVLAGPDRPGSNRSQDLLVSRVNLDDTARAVLDVHLVYAGDYAYQPDERPSLGAMSLVLHEPTQGPGQAERAFQGLLLVGALALIAFGIVGGWWLKRRRAK
jgi:hypothetical protein